MKKKAETKIVFPHPPLGFGGIVGGPTNFDPFGSYTGLTPERDEIPVQDADDL